MQVDAMSPVIHSDPHILGGTPVFRGTRVPADSLVAHLKADYSVDAFLEQFPTVRRDQILRILDDAESKLLQRNSSR